MSGFAPTPNVADFTTFLYNVVGISPVILPSTSPYIGYAFGVALAIANPNLASIGGTNTAIGAASIYPLAVYNLAADIFINYVQDEPGRTDFQTMRTNFGISQFVPGVITSSSDVSTSQTTLNPEFMKTLTLGDLQNLKTPYGRQYLSFAQQVGSLWGMV